MNLNKLREAVEVVEELRQEQYDMASGDFCKKYFTEPEIVKKITGRAIALQKLIALAEDVIRLQGVMPEKRKLNKTVDEAPQHLVYEIYGYNKAIDDCIKAISGRVNVEEIKELIMNAEQSFFEGNPPDIRNREKYIAQAIVKHILGDKEGENNNA